MSAHARIMASPTAATRAGVVGATTVGPDPLSVAPYAPAARADAVTAWMLASGEVLDGYPDEEVVTEEMLDDERASMEIRLSPIFQGPVLAPGAGLALVVSRGAPTISVPDLLGMSIADARTRLELDGLQLGTPTRRRTPDGAPGTVIEQRPAAGTLASPGTVVDIVVARSP